MGTNYYVISDVCPHCGRSDPAIHIGKSSCGWRFAFHLHPEHYANFKTFCEWIKGKHIKDEYNKDLSVEDFLELVKGKQSVKREDEPRWDARPPGSLYEGETEIDGYRFLEHDFS